MLPIDRQILFWVLVLIFCWIGQYIIFGILANMFAVAAEGIQYVGWFITHLHHIL
jgi:hypothetical protein